MNGVKKQADYLKQSISKYQPFNPYAQYSPMELEYYDALSFNNKIAHAYLPHELKEIYQQIVDLGSEIVRQIEEICENFALNQ